MNTIQLSPKAKLNHKTVKKLLTVIDAGLVNGVGKPKPGEMCVEAAVCYALGLPHGDDPKCVLPSLRSYKISLNDSRWSSNEARAKGLRRLAVAQLGTLDLDPLRFVELLAIRTVRDILPLCLTDEGLIAKCNAVTTLSEAKSAAHAAAAYAAYAIAAAAAAAHAAAAAAAYAAYAIADSAAADAAYAIAAAAAAAHAADAHAAAADAADAHAAAADAAAAHAKRDKVLAASAEMCVQILIEMNAPACKYLPELE